jgi:ribosomal protein S18 acetylase RimI-like enzyme
LDNNIEFRLSTADDTEVLTNFRLLLLREVRGKEDDEATEVLRKNIAEYMPVAVNSGTYIGWMAIVNEVVAGVGGMAIRQQPPGYKYPNGKLGYIMNMYTLPQYRGRGICTMLMEKIMQSAREQGICKVELHATNEGEPIYRKFGFAEPKSLVLEWNG